MSLAAKTVPDEDQPRTIEQPCSHCGQAREVLNGEHFGHQRRQAKITLVEMKRIFKTCGELVSVSYLSQMERGLRPFPAKFEVIYVRLLDRRRRSGED